MLEASFFARSTLQVAQDLIGCLLVHDRAGLQLCGRIVETEAYIGPDDAASHAHRGRTPRNAVMFGPPGRAYVYLVYGMHHCLNVVTQPDGYPAAVLIRALEPLGELGPCNGPGRLTRAMGIHRDHSGLQMTRPPLYFEPAARRPARVLATCRIGVDYAGEWAGRPWRFLDPDSRHLSRPVRPCE